MTIVAFSYILGFGLSFGVVAFLTSLVTIELGLLRSIKNVQVRYLDNLLVASQSL